MNELQKILESISSDVKIIDDDIVELAALVGKITSRSIEQSVTHNLNTPTVNSFSTVIVSKIAVILTQMVESKEGQKDLPLFLSLCTQSMKMELESMEFPDHNLTHKSENIMH